jgi:hypothetical protein
MKSNVLEPLSGFHFGHTSAWWHRNQGLDMMIPGDKEGQGLSYSTWETVQRVMGGDAPLFLRLRYGITNYVETQGFPSNGTSCWRRHCMRICSVGLPTGVTCVYYMFSMCMLFHRTWIGSRSGQRFWMIQSCHCNIVWPCPCVSLDAPPQIAWLCNNQKCH